MKPATVSASLAVISTASKYLHNDLARAIEALAPKKSRASGEVEEMTEQKKYKTKNKLRNKTSRKKGDQQSKQTGTDTESRKE